MATTTKRRSSNAGQFPRVKQELAHAATPTASDSAVGAFTTAAPPAPAPSPFRFELGIEASIAVSHERGTIIARGEYISSEPQYLLRYKANDGRAVETWWLESALTTVA